MTDTPLPYDIPNYVAKAFADLHGKSQMDAEPYDDLCWYDGSNFSRPFRAHQTWWPFTLVPVYYYFLKKYFVLFKIVYLNDEWYF